MVELLFSLLNSDEDTQHLDEPMNIDFAFNYNEPNGQSINQIKKVRINIIKTKNKITCNFGPMQISDKLCKS